MRNGLPSQLTEACGWDEPPRYLIARPRRRVSRCLHPAHPRHRHSRPTGLLIGSIRRECLDHAVVGGERIFATSSHRTKNTTTRSERTYRCRRTRRFGVMCAEQGACVRHRSWAATRSICFRQGQLSMPNVDDREVRDVGDRFFPARCRLDAARHFRRSSAISAAEPCRSGRRAICSNVRMTPRCRSCGRVCQTGGGGCLLITRSKPTRQDIQRLKSDPR